MEIDTSEAPLTDLQKRAAELLDGLRDVDKDIRKVTGRNYSDLRRNFNNKFVRRRIARDRLPSIDKESPAPVNPDEAEKPPNDSEQNVVMSEVVPPSNPALPAEEPVAVPDEETSKRSKRMFGHLMGTLNQFKVQNDGFRDKAIMRQEIEKRVEEKAIKEREEIIKQRRELLQARREKQRDLRQIRRQIWIKELGQLCEDSKQMGSFILTTSQPPVYYLPAKSNSEVERCIAKSKESLLKRLSEFETQIPEFTALRNPDPPREIKAESDTHRDDEKHTSSESSNEFDHKESQCPEDETQ